LEAWGEYVTKLVRPEPVGDNVFVLPRRG
jgi:hypothetical protein